MILGAAYLEVATGWPEHPHQGALVDGQEEWRRLHLTFEESRVPLGLDWETVDEQGRLRSDRKCVSVTQKEQLLAIIEQPRRPLRQEGLDNLEPTARYVSIHGQQALRTDDE